MSHEGVGSPNVCVAVQELCSSLSLNPLPQDVTGGGGFLSLLTLAQVKGPRFFAKAVFPQNIYGTCGTVLGRHMY